MACAAVGGGIGERALSNPGHRRDGFGTLDTRAARRRLGLVGGRVRAWGRPGTCNGLLGARGALERLDLAASEFAPPGPGDSLESERAHGDAFEFLDRASDGGEEAADLTISAFLQAEFEDRSIAVALVDRHTDAGGARRADRLALATFGEVDAALDLLRVGIAQAALHDGVVGFLDAEAGVSEAIGELAVVGEQEESGGVVVEPSDGEEADGGGMLNQVKDGSSRVALLGACGAEGVRGLVEHDVEEARGGLDGLASNFDAIARGIDPRRACADGRAVDADEALLDEGLAGSARGDAGVGKVGVQSNARGRFDR